MAIHTIIFDLGGVVLNLDQDRTLRAFRRLGADLDQLNYQSTLFLDFETGKIHADDFIQYLNAILKGSATKEQITAAWNAMLLDLPAQRLELIKRLKNKYRLLLLSNTNTLHMEAIFSEHTRELFDALFDKVYLSYEMGLRKPNVECYEYVLQDAGIKGSESLFVDDSRGNIKGAEAAGINSLWAHEPIDTWFIDELKKHDVLKLQKK